MQAQVGVKKIQELLLDSEGNAHNLSQSMTEHYSQLRSKVDRMEMIHGLKMALDNEDVMFAITIDIYKSLLNFLL